MEFAIPREEIVRKRCDVIQFGTRLSDKHVMRYLAFISLLVLFSLLGTQNVLVFAAADDGEDGGEVEMPVIRLWEMSKPPPQVPVQAQVSTVPPNPESVRAPASLSKSPIDEEDDVDEGKPPGQGKFIDLD